MNQDSLNYLKVLYWSTAAAIAQCIVAVYLNAFLFVLILLSTSNKEKMVTDVVLGRKVPIIVFIKNKALLK